MSANQSAMRRWMDEEISTGKFCELVSVPRHIGEEQILHDVWLLKERCTALERAIAELRALLPLEPYQLDAYVSATFLPAVKEALKP